MNFVLTARRCRLLLAGTLAASSAMAASTHAASLAAAPALTPSTATLSPAVAVTPGITAFLQSNVPKTVEFDPSTNQAIYVGTGNATDTSTGWQLAPGAQTIAGGWVPITPSSAGPSTATPAVSGPDNPCSGTDFCLLASQVPYADFGYHGSGTKNVNIPNRGGYDTQNWPGFVIADGVRYPDVGKHTTILFGQAETVTQLDIN